VEATCTDPLYEVQSVLLGQSPGGSGASVHVHCVEDLAVGPMMPLCGHEVPLQQAAEHQQDCTEHGAFLNKDER